MSTSYRFHVLTTENRFNLESSCIRASKRFKYPWYKCFKHPWLKRFNIVGLKINELLENVDYIIPLHLGGYF